MITTARQLKDLIRNLSKKKSADAQILMRNYMMERFLERIALSDYKDRFILKGGMLVAAMVGLDARATMAVWARSLSGGSLYGQSPQALFYHSYTLPAYNDEGEEKDITFNTSRELKEGAFIRLEVVPIRGVVSWAEVQYDEMPSAVQSNYAAPISDSDS